jgi:hypothetical protein
VALINSYFLIATNFPVDNIIWIELLGDGGGSDYGIIIVINNAIIKKDELINDGKLSKKAACQIKEGGEGDEVSEEV